MDKITVFLTGGTGNIGYELIKDLSGSGFNVYFSSRDQQKITNIESEFQNKGDSAGFVKGVLLDFSDSAYLSVLQHFFNEMEHKPSVLINNVRDLKNLAVNKYGITDGKTFLNELELAIIVPYELSMMMANDNSFHLNNIINIASIYGVVPPKGALYDDGYKSSPIQYGVAKAGLIHMTKELSVRLAAQGVRVNCISYGGVEGRANEEFKKRYMELVPIRRMIKKTEVGGPVKFLASAASEGMTGQNLIYDGGYTTW